MALICMNAEHKNDGLKKLKQKHESKKNSKFKLAINPLFFFSFQYFCWQLKEVKRAVRYMCPYQDCSLYTCTRK